MAEHPLGGRGPLRQRLRPGQGAGGHGRGALTSPTLSSAVLPEFMRAGEGLAIAVGALHRHHDQLHERRRDGLGHRPDHGAHEHHQRDQHPWMVGLATAFASSFAHMLVIGTPNNAIAFALAKDPVTGEQLVTLEDFLKHGFVVLLLCFAVLILWDNPGVLALDRFLDPARRLNNGQQDQAADRRRRGAVPRLHRGAAGAARLRRHQGQPGRRGAGDRPASRSSTWRCST